MSTTNQSVESMRNYLNDHQYFIRGNESVVYDDRNPDQTVEWKASDTSKVVFSGEIEFQDNKGEFQHFHVIATKERVIFGGCCNVGFIESGYIEREETESLDETLQEMLADLETYYNDGPQYVSRIVCNERM